MFLLIRITILVLVPLLFYCAAQTWSPLVEKESLRYLAVVFSVVWGGVLWIFNKLNDVAKVDGLVARERERLRDATQGIRHRLWWISGVCLGSAGSFFLLSAATETDRNVVAIASGALIGIALSYLVVVPRWHEELQSFIEKVRDREEQRKELERAMKDMPEPHV